MGDRSGGATPVPACPVCGRPAPTDGPARPFCSVRCKMVDLGRWFTESYRVPGEDAVTLEEPETEEETDPGPSR